MAFLWNIFNYIKIIYYSSLIVFYLVNKRVIEGFYNYFLLSYLYTFLIIYLFFICLDFLIEKFIYYLCHIYLYKNENYVK